MRGSSFKRLSSTIHYHCSGENRDSPDDAACLNCLIDNPLVHTSRIDNRMNPWSQYPYIHLFSKSIVINDEAAGMLPAARCKMHSDLSSYPPYIPAAQHEEIHFICHISFPEADISSQIPGIAMIYLCRILFSACCGDSASGLIIPPSPLRELHTV